MIQVNTKTLTATRVSLPAALVGLSQDTLQNLQTQLGPVPIEFKDIEFWPEADTSTPLGQHERYGAETLTPHVASKTVHVARTVEPFSSAELAAEAAANIAALQASIVSAAQARLDAFAQIRGYDNILSLCNYAGDEDAIFNAEGTLGKRKRSQTWRKLTIIMQEVMTGVRPAPTSFADIEPELPVLSWTAQV